MRIHFAGEHALELKVLYALLDFKYVALHFGNGGLIVFGERHFEQLGIVFERRTNFIEPADNVLELCAFSAQFLSYFRLIPDFRIFEFTADFF
jgi:hypothetical protein